MLKQAYLRGFQEAIAEFDKTAGYGTAAAIGAALGVPLGWEKGRILGLYMSDSPHYRDVQINQDISGILNALGFGAAGALTGMGVYKYLKNTGRLL